MKPAYTLADFAGLALFVLLVALTIWLLGGCTANADRQFRSRVESIDGYAKASRDREGDTSGYIGARVTFRQP